MSNYNAVRKSRFKRSIVILERMGYLPKLNEKDVFELLRKMMIMDDQII